MRTDYAAYESIHLVRVQQRLMADLVQIHSSEYGSTT